MRNVFYGIIFILIVSTISHFLYSHLGFNPSDDGFILSGSRRIIDGEVPHRDFISIRPAGSHFLHVPFILIGGDYVIWLSRYFAWAQWACIGWIWATIIGNSFKIFSSIREKYAFALVAFCFSVNTFPIMVWHTLDALFFSSIGLVFALQRSKNFKYFGYFILGMAPLFKLNFLPVLPLAIIILNDWRIKHYWITMSIPILLYFLYLAMNGAAYDGFIQLTSYSNIFESGIWPYIKTSGTIAGLLVGFVAMSMAYQKIDLKLFQNKKENAPTSKVKIDIQAFLGILILFLIPISVIFVLLFRNGLYMYEPAFAVFGTVLGILIFQLKEAKKFTPVIRCGLLTISIAWCASISIGHPTPFLGLGPLVLYLIGTAYLTIRDKWIIENLSGSGEVRVIGSLSLKRIRTYCKILTFLFILIVPLVFGISRFEHIYYEKPASELTYELDDVFPGGKNLRTNENTYNYLKELQTLKNDIRSRDKKYCIVPDTSADWIRSTQKNPLSVDWPHDIELLNQDFRDQVYSDLEDLRGDAVIIVQKYHLPNLKDGGRPISEGDRYIVDYVRSNFNKTSETDFFELYE